MYPNANIWVIGHSLGGALASLLGVTFGAPVVAFEAPGESMAARRLHVPSPVCSLVLYFVYARSLSARHLAAVDPPHHTCVAHGRSDRYGHMYGLAVDVRHGRVCDGEPLPPWEHHRIRHRYEPLLVRAPYDPPNRNSHRPRTFEAMAYCGGTRSRSAADEEAR
jgi:hypothetical protein